MDSTPKRGPSLSVKPVSGPVPVIHQVHVISVKVYPCPGKETRRESGNICVSELPGFLRPDQAVSDGVSTFRPWLPPGRYDVRIIPQDPRLRTTPAPASG